MKMGIEEILKRRKERGQHLTIQMSFAVHRRT
jgi:hypothetical protein